MTTAKTERTDWLDPLRAVPCRPSPAQWEGWTTAVATFCASFDALFPKRTAQEWRDHWHDEYGKPPLRRRDGSARTVVEFEVVKAFRAHGWGAVWVDTFGAAPPWMKAWTRADIPLVAESLVDRIRGQSAGAKPWDVLAWRGADVMFVECKAVSQKFTKSEQAFLWGPTRLA